MSECIVAECRSPILIKSRGLCKKHYQRWHKHGDVMHGEGRFDKKTCTIPGCDAKHEARGYCHKHYEYWRVHGTVEKPDESERFWQKVEKTDSCWNWIAYRNTHGYGSYSVDDVLVPAHRHSFQLLIGDIPDGMEIDHMCHNRACVNPDHLRPVTRKQNTENVVGANRNNKTSGLRNVYLDRRSGRWMVRIAHNGHSYNFGGYETLAEAGAVALSRRKQLFTHNDYDRKVNFYA